MKTTIVRETAVLNERKKGLAPAIRLFNYYTDHVDELNKITRTKAELAVALNVSERTVTNWIHALVNVDVIKYKYSGATRLNPAIWFIGKVKHYKQALEEYKLFRSDI